MTATTLTLETLNKLALTLGYRVTPHDPGWCNRDNPDLMFDLYELFLPKDDLICFGWPLERIHRYLINPNMHIWNYL